MVKKPGGGQKRKDAKAIQDPPTLFKTESQTTGAEVATVEQLSDSSCTDNTIDGLDGSVIWEPIDPCPRCQGLEFWWNVNDVRRCLLCDPPSHRGADVVALAAELKAKADKKRKRKAVKK